MTEVLKINVNTKSSTTIELRILATNIRSIFNKIENFEVDLNQINPDIVCLCLSEPWLNEDARSSFKMNNYKTVAEFHRKTSAGG